MVERFRAVSFEVFGKVQGVFFRKYTKKTASNLDIVGWVMNTTKGTVTGCIQGEKDDIETMKRWLKCEGSPKSKIDHCNFNEETDIDSLEFKEFKIQR